MLNYDQAPRPAPQRHAPRLIDFIGRDGTVPIKALLDAGLGSLLGGRFDLGGGCTVSPPGNTDLALALADVRVCRFRTEVRQPGPPAGVKGKPAERGKSPAGYHLVQQIGLSSTRRIGVMLSKPVDTILSFGGSPDDSARSAGSAEPPASRPTKPKKAPAPIPGAECDILIHSERDAKGTVRLLRISGTTVRFHMSRRLVLPVMRTAGEWAVGPNRVAIRLGTASIQLRRGIAPRVSTPLDCHGAMVEIAHRGMLAQLGTATLGGTFERPQIIFDDIRLVGP